MKCGIAAVALVGLAAGAAAERFVPTGAKIEASGFATVERAPPAPYAEEPPPADDRPQGEAEWYARDLGISVQEAAKRQREQQAIRPEFERLLATLRQREAGNFTAPRLVHEPDWAYVFYFQRDPDRTLAKHTSNPRFRAALARYSREELQRLAQPWADRFIKHRLIGGWGTDDTSGTAEMTMTVTEEEYREIAAREGWGPVPEAIELRFSAPLPHRSVEDAARPFVRVLAQDDRSTGAQLLAAASGRIVLHDGCLYVGQQLAYFHRETGVGVDEQGYLALKDRATGKARGRIGEWFTWAGPNGISEDMPMLAELRARCGDAPVLNVGNPDSTAQFRVRAWKIDEIARQRRISRQRAWELLKACWARQDAANPDKPPSEDCALRLR